VKTSKIVWLLLSLIYAPVFFQLYQSRWEAIDYTHAYFVLPVSLWMAYRKRQELKTLALQFVPSSGDNIGLLALIPGLLMFIFGWRQNFLIVSSFSMIPVVWGLVRFLHGPLIVKALRLPILYLLFLVPPPLGVLDKITLPMRYGISGLAEVILRSLNYPISKSGLLLTMGGNEIFMGAPCSGFRSLITMLALTVAYVSFSKGSFHKKVILTLSGIPFALFGNLIRVMCLCLMTYYAGKEAAEGFFHGFSGGVIFLVMILSLMGLENFLGRFKNI
jgi:exosortase